MKTMKVYNVVMIGAQLSQRGHGMKIYIDVIKKMTLYCPHRFFNSLLCPLNVYEHWTSNPASLFYGEEVLILKIP